MQRILLFSHACVVPANAELFRELGKNFELRFVVPQRWRGSLIRDLGAVAESDVFRYPVIFSGNGSLFFYRSWMREARAFHPDLVFLDEEPWSLAALQAYLLFPRAKKVFYTKQNLRKRVPWPFSWIQQFVFGRSARAFVISEETRDVLRWKGYRGEAVCLPHSVDPARFRTLDIETKKSLRRERGLPVEAFLVGYFGRITEDKGLREIFSAAEESGPEEELHFVVVGDGPLAGEARAFAASNPAKFTFLPALAHHLVQETMAIMDVTILPSRTTPRWKEQFGRVIIESAACGVPVVGSDSGEIPVLIRENNCGLVFKEGDAAALLRCLRQMAGNAAHWREVGRRSRETISARYSHGAVGEELTRELGS